MAFSFTVSTRVRPRMASRNSPVVFGEQQVHHEFDDFSRREVLTSGLVGLL